MGQELKKNSKNGLFIAIMAVFLVIMTAWLTPYVSKIVANPTIVEQTINEVNAIALDSNAVTYTYLIDKQTTVPIFVGNSVGYPINPATGEVLEGALINIIDKNGNRYPSWRSLDGTMWVTPLKLHHDGWTDQDEQLPIARFDSTKVVSPPPVTIPENIVPKK